jgi:predicted Zn-dependent protease
MGAKVQTGASTIYIDYSGRMSIRSRVRTVSDLRATAQYFSNYAYELMHDSYMAGEPIPWGEVARRFEIATRIEPALPQAWNNLGVARSRLGDVGGAERAYEKAIALAGSLDSAERNLRLLHGLPREPKDVGHPGTPAGWLPVDHTD